MLALAASLAPGLLAAVVLVGVGFLAGIAATIWFEWWTAARDLAPRYED